MSSTCVEMNNNIQDVDAITEEVQSQPHQHIPPLELIETGSRGSDTPGEGAHTPYQYQYQYQCS